MARKARSVEVLESLRRQSGWYLAAWRDYRSLTLDELAAEAGTSKGAVSEFETGKPRSDGSSIRFNRTTIETMARALSTTGGFLLDVNPFTADQGSLQLQDRLRGLAPDQLETALRLLDALSPKGSAVAQDS